MDNSCTPWHSELEHSHVEQAHLLTNSLSLSPLPRGSIPHCRGLHAHASRFLSPLIQNSSKPPTASPWSVLRPGAHTTSIALCLAEDGHKEESPSGPKSRFGVIWARKSGVPGSCVWSRSREARSLGRLGSGWALFLGLANSLSCGRHS